MAPRWYPTVIATPLYDGRDRPAIDLEMESQIPSEVRHSFHNQATKRGTPLRNSAYGNCAQKSKNQKNLADETVSRFHGIYYAYEWFFASADASNFHHSLKSPTCRSRCQLHRKRHSLHYSFLSVSLNGMVRSTLP